MAPPNNPVKILLIDRVAMLREALHAMISQCQALRIVGETGDPKEVVPLMEARHPGVLVFHLEAGDEDMCWRRPKIDPVCRLKNDPGTQAVFEPNSHG